MFLGRIALGGSDYVGRSNLQLTISKSINVPVNLIDDNFFEGEEDFNGILTLISGENVTISPDNALATIVDDEGM